MFFSEVYIVFILALHFCLANLGGKPKINLIFIWFKKYTDLYGNFP